MRLIVGIPNYNGGKNLIHLLPQLLDEDFDAIYILDDASTDDSLALLYEFSERVEVIEGEKNLGPGGNRNRIIPHIQDDDIVMFIDSDTILKTRNVRSMAIGIFKSNKNVALVGGGVLNKRGKPMGFNYGIQVSKTKDIIGIFFAYLAALLHFRFLVWPIRALARQFTLNVEIAHFPPKRRVVDWVAEGHFYVRGSVFKQLNGFDPDLLYGEGKDFARRVREEGLTILFDPSIWVQHLEYKVRTVNKTVEHNKVRAKEAAAKAQNKEDER